MILDRIASPGNLGTLIRSCDALGVDGILLAGHTADLYAPETIRATTGSFFALPVVGTSARAEIALASYDFSAPTILLVGNENHGLSVRYRDMCDALVTIPMMGAASSRNVACAASICLYEISRQRGK